MRIVSGSLGGRVFDSPGTERTHPMSDKMRGALFNILGDLTDLTVLDAFGGSGALAFEAISRGAATALILEQDRLAQKTIASNMAKLGLRGAVTLANVAAGSWLTTSEAQYFDVILCDPPYDDLQPHLLERLAQRVAPNGIFVLSCPVSSPVLTLPSLEHLRQQTYGTAQLLFYRRGVID
ncbi:MAG TPA: RsmD family RNA methyltransferase [Patescibacteria group bacterium]|nr:RsmD family RNA methyltransferase [Patescibacteria group bacterium]